MSLTGARPVTSPGYTMDSCLKCHFVNPADTKSCEKCHLKGETGRLAKNSSWRLTHGPDWRTTHGLGDLNTCKACHTADKCVGCHNMPVPHPDGFKSQHGTEVLARPTGSRDCLVCHKKARATGATACPCHTPSPSCLRTRSWSRRGQGVVLPLPRPGVVRRVPRAAHPSRASSLTT